MAEAKLCAVDDCGKPAYVRGWCTTHYQRWKRHGDPLEGGWAKAAQCIIDGCEKPPQAHGWCAAHYKRFRKHGSPLGGGPDKPRGRVCAVPECGSKHYGGGYCRKHYERAKLHGDPQKTERTPPGEPLAWLAEHKSFRGIECLIFPYNRAIGYGRVVLDGLPQLAHRVMCEFAHGPAPSPAYLALHSCGKGHEGCVNPEHLYWGTHQDNSDDKFTHGTIPLGERNHNTKLTEDQVRLIRSMGDTHTRKEIAEFFGVHPSTVQHVISRRNWKWLD